MPPKRSFKLFKNFVTLILILKLTLKSFNAHQQKLINDYFSQWEIEKNRHYSHNLHKDEKEVLDE